MPDHLPKLPRLRWLSDPADYEPLAGFKCGGTSDYEHDVEEALAQLRDFDPEEAAEFKIRIAEATHGDGLIGLSVFQERPLNESKEFAGSIWLALTAINESYRGWRMPDGSTGIGTFLLCDALAQIDEISPDSMPYVWGTVHQDNKDCHSMLTRHHFWRLKDSKRDPSGAYFVYLRPDHLDWAKGFSAQIRSAVQQASDLSG